jgi:transcriptional regulator
VADTPTSAANVLPVPRPSRSPSRKEPEIYVTNFNRVHDLAAIRAMVAAAGAAELITTGADGYPEATLLPVVWTEDVVLMHMARANPHWKQIPDGSPALLVCDGAQAYVSPAWYPSKAEHGKVVPTWNYTSVQIRGTATVHEDPEWLRAQVDTLTDAHERDRSHPWQAADAPDAFIDSQLRGIVGVELRVESADGKAKLSQNKSAQDQDGVIDGLTRERTAEAAAVADLMRLAREPSTP